MQRTPHIRLHNAASGRRDRDPMVRWHHGALWAYARHLAPGASRQEPLFFSVAWEWTRRARAGARYGVSPM